MLVVERNQTYVTWNLGDSVHPLEYTGDIVITFDPSKTNTAMIIGTPDKEVLNVLEFSGNNRSRGPVIDTTLFCEQVKQFLRQYLCHANLYKVGIEKTILPRGKKANYHSVTVLNEIRSNLLSFFLEQFQMHVIEINNWSWKSAMLPEGYRSPYEKGSKRYFTTFMPDSEWSKYYEADVTDCLCMFWYMCEKSCADYTVYCNRVEQSFTGYTYTYVPADSIICSDLRAVAFNDRFSLEDNLSFYSNRILVPFYLEVDSSILDFRDVYGKSMCFTKNNLKDTRVKVVAKRA